ncbi:MAG: alanine dehydrogenase [Bacteroidales bacterium]|nr:alanine dehydrogenase [Bacteroidales bacterium]MBN2818985.1 alanine dehydrogenase [Bacteroidales bacterium]
MIIGCVKEIKTHEYRVGLTPSDVKSYVMRGHHVLIQSNAGTNAGFEDESYRQAGAEMMAGREDIFSRSEMIVKVKEPLPEEYPLFKENQILYTYLHLAADKRLTEALMARKIKGVAYETIEKADGQLPCLKPMSEIAGRLSVQEGAKYLEKTFGGRGVLLGGVPGVARGKVAIIGGGIVGTNACKIAAGMGADVTILDIDADRLSYLDDIFGSRITTLYSTDANIESVLKESDLVIGAVLLPGAKAPTLVNREHLKLMKKGSVIVDVAVDQGGCVETIKPTTHDNPVYVIDDVVHYGVANMPGAVALSSTKALTSTTLPYGLMIAEMGLEEACKQSPDIYRGVNLYKGHCTYENVAKAFNMNYVELSSLL